MIGDLDVNRDAFYQEKEDNNNKTIILDEYNTISRIKHEVNEKYPMWHPHQDKKYPDEKEHHEDLIKVLNGI